jgi:hypothetical protein
VAEAALELRIGLNGNRFDGDDLVRPAVLNGLKLAASAKMSCKCAPSVVSVGEKTTTSSLQGGSRGHGGRSFSCQPERYGASAQVPTEPGPFQSGFIHGSNAGCAADGAELIAEDVALPGLYSASISLA